MGKPLDSEHNYNEQLLLKTLFLAPTEYWPWGWYYYGRNTKILRVNMKRPNSILSIMTRILCLKPAELKH